MESLSVIKCPLSSICGLIIWYIVICMLLRNQGLKAQLFGWRPACEVSAVVSRGNSVFILDAPPLAPRALPIRVRTGSTLKAAICLQVKFTARFQNEAEEPG